MIFNMLKVLFLIHDLGQGGAEKVLLNLVRNMNRLKFDITIMSLFGGGINEKFLPDDIHYKVVFPRMLPGNSKLMKLLNPKQLHKIFIKDEYDIEVSYLEGPSARVVSGCTNSNTKLVSWIHVEQHTIKNLAKPFRNEDEANVCYNQFDKTVCVSDYVRNDFCKILDFKKPCITLYNTVESEAILTASKETVDDMNDDAEIRLVAVGTLKPSKGYDRLLRIVKRLNDEKYSIHLYVLGTGLLQQELEKYITENDLERTISLLGYQTNPYKYVAKCDLLVCASHAEGFSTAATEALIVGTPVCTVDVSGMKELLGENNEYGVVTLNDEEALYKDIKKLLDDRECLKDYKNKALERGKMFKTHNTVKAVEDMLLEL